MNGNLRTGNKTILQDVQTSDVQCPQTISVPRSLTLIIDRQALVVAIGKPNNASTFGEFSDAYIRCVTHMSQQLNRIDVVFDRYSEESIKTSTRTRRKKGAPIWRVIISGDIYTITS